jgi:hypothetical protein
MKPGARLRLRRGALVVLDVLGKLWAAPVSLAGLLLGLPALAFGARLSIGDNAIRFTGFPMGSGALALGNVVIYAGLLRPRHRACMYGDRRLLDVGLHERAHTLQYQVLGPLFLPVYFLCGGIDAGNPFERAANTYAAGGAWWPGRASA